MDIQKFNTAPLIAKIVLVAPLDWGLGHVTRCIPIINALLKRGNTVIIAATGERKILLATEFPGIEIIDLPEYRVRLSASSGGFAGGLLLQIPRLWAVKREETEWLKNLIRTRRIDLVISDNRYGLFHKDVHCIFVTHQLFIISGLGRRFDRWLMKLHFRLIDRFSECWIPDNKDRQQSLAGRLSHPPDTPPFPVTYLGLLSRFAFAGTTGDLHTQPHLLILLSGPEPQRAIAEAIIVKQLNDYNGPIVLVRGLPAQPTGSLTAEKTDGQKSNLRIVNHLPAAEMQQAITSAAAIVCRSGYSTLMDLVALRRTAVLIPTPGQPEQEYLAAYMAENGWMTSRRQSAFSLMEMFPGTTATTKSYSGPPAREFVFFTGELPALTLRRTLENRT